MALAAWGGGWLWMKAGIEKEMDAVASRLQASGGRFFWSERRITGYPFRFDVDLSNLVWQGPDGWGVSVPELKSETSIFAFGHWVAYAPAGATLLRPSGGLRISAQALRASISGSGAHPPVFSLEGLGLAFTPEPGAAPFSLASADALHVHTRAGPSDLGAFLIEVDGARLADQGFFGRLSAGAATNLIVDARLDHASALRGRDWSDGLQTWSRSGGHLSVKQARFSIASVSLTGQGGDLAIGPDGRLAGSLEVNLTGDVSGHALPYGRVTLDLAGGRGRLGPFDIGPSPKLY
jgi:hypothetical protein